MTNPFAKLGLPTSADPEEVHRAYRSLVKQCHPDIFQDETEQQAAQEKMIELNLAYEEALKISKEHKQVKCSHTVSEETAEKLAAQLLARQSPEAALRQLDRAEDRDGSWYALRGKILMVMGRFQDAHAAFRKAVKLDPDNMEYGRGALDAAVEMKKQKSLPRRIVNAFSQAWKKFR